MCLDADTASVFATCAGEIQGCLGRTSTALWVSSTRRAYPWEAGEAKTQSCLGRVCTSLLFLTLMIIWQQR